MIFFNIIFIKIYFSECIKTSIFTAWAVYWLPGRLSGQPIPGLGLKLQTPGILAVQANKLPMCCHGSA
jgi:hypothetical protein